MFIRILVISGVFVASINCADSNLREQEKNKLALQSHIRQFKSINPEIVSELLEETETLSIRTKEDLDAFKRSVESFFIKSKEEVPATDEELVDKSLKNDSLRDIQNLANEIFLSKTKRQSILCNRFNQNYKESDSVNAKIKELKTLKVINTSDIPKFAEELADLYLQNFKNIKKKYFYHGSGGGGQG